MLTEAALAAFDASTKPASKSYHMQRFLHTLAPCDPHVVGRSRRQHDQHLIAVLDDIVTCVQGTAAPGSNSAATSRS